jgi:hypothetical protein
LHFYKCFDMVPSMKWKYAIVAVVAFFAGFLFSRGLGENTASPLVRDYYDVSDTVTTTQITATTSAIENSIETKSSSAIGGYSVRVDDQPAGIVVFLSSMSLRETGWIAVHEDREGAPGNILGAQRFFGGNYPQGGSVELQRGTQPDAIYYVMMHIDDGVDGFDHALDVPFQSKSGELIMDMFHATAFSVPQ